MVDTSHSIDRDKRFTRVRNENCPICGVDYESAREVSYRQSDDGVERIDGIEYDHQVSRCVEWADGGIGQPAE